MPTDNRVNVVLPPADLALADAIAEKLGAGSRGRSIAIRYGLRCAAEKLGLLLELPKHKKKNK